MDALLNVWIFGGIILAVGLIYKFFPPKKINNWYGYRTARSMNSQEVWEYANKLGPNLIFAGGFLSILVGSITAYIQPEKANTAALVAMFVGAIGGIVWIEGKLNKKFGKPNP